MHEYRIVVYIILSIADLVVPIILIKELPSYYGEVQIIPKLLEGFVVCIYLS